MQIIKASAMDAAELTALVNSAYRGETSKLGWTTESHLLDGIRIDEPTFNAYFQHADISILKAVDADGTACGCVYLELKAPKLYLGMLTVSPLLQDKGIGRQLLDAAFNYACEMRLQAIMITVISSRHELIGWYERRGFKLTGEKKDFPTGEKFGKAKQHIELLVMEKNV
jgi:ribosomal protein S18 acetylase RimI-like enzyme